MHRAQAHDVEVRAADDAGADDARLAEADHRELDRREVAERGERLHPAWRSRSRAPRTLAFVRADARRALADVNQPVLVAVHQRPQQHAADDAEDRGVGADAERERDDDGDGQALDPGQRAQREAEVGQEAHKGSITRSSATLCDRAVYLNVEAGWLKSTSALVDFSRACHFRINGPGDRVTARFARTRRGGRSSPRFRPSSPSSSLASALPSRGRAASAQSSSGRGPR